MIGKKYIAPAFFYRTRGKVRKTWHWDLYLVADCVYVYVHTPREDLWCFFLHGDSVGTFGPNVVVELLAFVLRIRKVPGSNLLPETSGRVIFFVVCLSLSRQMPGWLLRFDHDAFFHVTFASLSTDLHIRHCIIISVGNVVKSCCVGHPCVKLLGHWAFFVSCVMQYNCDDMILPAWLIALWLLSNVKQWKDVDWKIKQCLSPDSSRIIRWSCCYVNAYQLQTPVTGRHET
jgi:hypothetical protein